MFISDSQYIGLDVSTNSLRIARIRKTRKGWDVPLIKEIFSHDHVKLLNKQLSNEMTISALDNRDILLRTCEIPLKKTKDIFAALEFHVEPLLPYSLEKAVIQSKVIHQSEQSTLLSIFAARKDHLEQHLQIFTKFQIEPEVTTSKAHALAAFSSLLPQSESLQLIVHESEEEISFVLIEKGEIITARSLDPKKHFLAEFQKTLLSLTAHYKNHSFDVIYYIGKNPEIKKALQTLSGKPVEIPESPFLSLTQEEWIHYSLAIGCALSHDTINFRQKEFVHPQPFRRFRKPIAIFFTLSLCLTGAIAIFSEIALADKKETLKEAYTALLYDETKKHEYLPTSSSDYLIHLSQLAQKIKAQPQRYPLLPQFPKVKEMLSWLVSLPSNRGVVIESLHYQLVSRPDLTHRHEKYKVKVDLEISASDINAARLFQEALKNEKTFIDTKEEVQWIPIKGRYNASFYLKDKTKYD